MVEARHHLSGHLVTHARHLHGEAAAMCHAEGTLTDGDVLRLRVISKELRALWQLLRPLDIAQSKNAASTLAEAAASLAGARDATVVAETLAALSQKAPRKSERQVFSDACKRLFPETEPAEIAVPAQLLDGLESDAARWKSVPANIDDRALVSKGLRRSWRKTRNRLLEAIDSDALEQWHALRKWVKYLTIQLELLEQAGLHSLLPVADTRRLARDLGRLHDIHVLIRHVDGHRAAFASDEEAGYCLHLLRNHEARMLDKCRTHAAHLTQVKPGRLRKHLLKQLP